MHSTRKDPIRPGLMNIPEAAFQQILNNSTAIVYIKDREGRHLFVNRPFLAVFGLDEEAVIGRTDREIFPADIAAGFHANDAKVFSGNETIEVEETAQQDDGLHTYLSIKFPLYDEQGATFAVCGISSDITERKRTEEALRSAAIGVSTARGRDIFKALVRYVATSLDADFAFIALPKEGCPGRMKTIAMWAQGRVIDDVEYDLAGSPCQDVYGQQFAFHPRETYRDFSGDAMLSEHRVEGYAGIPLFDSQGRAIGLMAVLTCKPLTDRRVPESILKIFSVRAAAELERVHAEEARTASEASYRSIFEASEDCVFVHDWDSGAILDVNPKACAVYGYTPEEMRRLDVGKLSSGAHPYTLGEAVKLIEKAKHGEPQRVEWHRRNKDGGLRWDEVHIKAATIAGERRILVFTRDITERKEREEALRKSESRLRAMVEAALDCVVGMDSEGRVTEFNAAAEQCFGYRRHEVLGKPLADLIVPERFRDAHRNGLQRYQRTREGAFLGRRVEIVGQRADGSEFPAELAIGVAQGKEGDMFIGYLRDITERRRAEQELRESEERYRLLFEMESDAIVLVDVETLQHLDVNRAALDLYGYSRDEMLGLRSTDLSAEPEQTQTAMKMGAGAVRIPLRHHRKKDGTVFPVEITANFFDLHGRKIMLAAIRDITERRQAEEERARLEAQLRQAQKMEAIGHLSGGIAHDFNNILTSVMGYVAMAQERQARYGDEKLNVYLERSLRAGRQARDLIQQMLTFSRGQRGALRALALAPLIKESIKLMRSTLPSSIEFETSLDASVPMTMADPVQIEQVLMNLCINARDAMHGSGILRIALDTAACGNEVCTSCRQPVEGRFVELSVADDGDGIAAEVVDRMFEPFFSTKELGKGSGMGLATVHGIVHEHRGHVIVETAPGKGASFRVLLPPIAHIEPPPEPRIGAKSTRSGGVLSGRILVVDDEESVCEFMAELLESWGLEVTTQANGVAAATLFAQNPDRFDLVITDQTMPKMTGLQLARELLALRPGLAIILYTGYAERLTEEQVKREGVRTLMTKPIDNNALFALLRDLLEQCRRGSSRC